MTIYQDKESRLGAEFVKQHRGKDDCIGVHNLDPKTYKIKYWLFAKHTKHGRINVQSVISEDKLTEMLMNHSLQTHFKKLHGIIVGRLPGPSVSGFLGSVKKSKNKRAKTCLGNLKFTAPGMSYNPKKTDDLIPMC